VLIQREEHHEDEMFGYFLIAFIVLVGPLAYWAGKDSRIDEVGRLDDYHR
jgi:hypothetical protein